MNILGISGSLRKGSFNTLLLKAATQAANAEGSNLTIVDISDIPFYNSDLDGEVKPDSVASFIDAIAHSDGIIFSTPEYNYSIPGVLKNAIDWASRPAYQSVLSKKPSGIISASTSPLGGARAQIHLRDILAGTLSPVFLTPDFLLPLAISAFDSNGTLNDPKAVERLNRYIKGYIAWVSSINNDKQGA